MKDLTINKLFVPYEESLELKELGFDEPCLFAFDNCSTPMRCSNLRTNEQKFNGVNYNSSTYTSQPTFSQAFRWFRDKYKLQSYIRHECSNVEYYYDFVINEDVYDVIKDTCEEAELACLRKLIDIVKKKQK